MDMFLKLNMIEIQNRAMANTALKMEIEKRQNVIKSKQAWADPGNFVGVGGPDNIVLVINLFHRGSYEPPSFEGGPHQYFYGNL